MGNPVRKEAMNFQRGIRRISSCAEEAFRLFCLKVPLAFAASFLPRKWALATADLAGRFIAVSFLGGCDVRSEMEQAFGTGKAEAFRLACASLAQPFRDSVVLRRFLRDRESLGDWIIKEKNAGAVEALRVSGKSYIVAVGHFSRQAILPILGSTVSPGRAMVLSLGTLSRPPGLQGLRTTTQLQLMLEAVLSARPDGVELAMVRQDTPFKLIRHLRGQGNVAFIHVDAPWSSEAGQSFERPFAGHGSRCFAVGAAKIARLARCPIVSCTWALEGDHTMVIKWGTPIDRHGVEMGRSDESVTSDLLRDIETAAGERPTQYVLNIGYGRQWRREARQWENRDSRERSNSPTNLRLFGRLQVSRFGRGARRRAGLNRIV
jgi:hypothetical protein